MRKKLSEAGLSELKDEQDYMALFNPVNPNILQILMQTKWYTKKEMI